MLRKGSRALLNEAALIANVSADPQLRDVVDFRRLEELSVVEQIRLVATSAALVTGTTLDPGGASAGSIAGGRAGGETAGKAPEARGRSHADPSRGRARRPEIRRLDRAAGARAGRRANDLAKYFQDWLER